MQFADLSRRVSIVPWQKLRFINIAQIDGFYLKKKVSIQILFYIVYIKKKLYSFFFEVDTYPWAGYWYNLDVSSRKSYRRDLWAVHTFR